MSTAAYQTAQTMAYHMESRNPINAIKELRAYPGIDFGLKAAKDVVDQAPGDYYNAIDYFESIINKRLVELTSKFVVKVETVTRVTLYIPGVVNAASLTADEARTLRDQLIALDLG